MLNLEEFCGEEAGNRAWLNNPFSIGDYSYATNGVIGVRVPRRDEVIENKKADLNGVGRVFAVIDENREYTPLSQLLLSKKRRANYCDIGVGRFDSHYVEMIQDLPNIAVGPISEKDPMVFRFDGGGGLLMPIKKDDASAPDATPAGDLEVMTINHPRWIEFYNNLSDALTAGLPEGQWRCMGNWNMNSIEGKPMDHYFSRGILAGMGNIDVDKSLEYFGTRGGHCDCEVLANVDPR